MQQSRKLVAASAIVQMKQQMLRPMKEVKMKTHGRYATGKQCFQFFVILVSILLSHACFSQCSTWYQDSDNDGFGNPDVTQTNLCSKPPGYVLNSLDCNDLTSNLSTWKLNGTGGISTDAVLDIRMAVAPDGTPYVMYRNQLPLGGMAVKKFIGGAWVVLGADPINTWDMRNGALAFDKNSVPYVSFLDFSATVPSDIKATVIKYNSTTSTWELVGGSRRFSQQATTNTVVNMVIDANDIPYVSLTNTSSDVIVMKFDGGWQEVGGGPLAPSLGTEATIALDGTGKPYVALIDNEGIQDYYVTVMQYNGTIWTPVGNPRFSDGEVSVAAPRIAIGGSGVPYVAYYDDDEDECVVQRYNSTTTAWEKVGPAFHSGLASYISLAVDRFDVPIVTYRVGTAAFFKKFIGGAWVDVVTTGSYNGTNRKFLSVTVAPNNIPYAAMSNEELGFGGRVIVISVAPVSAGNPLGPTASVSAASICPGASSNLNVTAGTLNDAARWQWYSGGCGTMGSTAIGSVTGTGVPINVSAGTSGTSADYFVRGEGPCITSPAACVTVTVNTYAVAEITADPTPTPQTFCEGANGVSFTVGAAGAGPLSYQWKRNGTNVGSLSTDPDYDFGSLTPGDAGAYTVEVSGTCGTDLSAAATLVVNAKTEIGTDPLAGPHTFCEGTSGVSFTVGASGTGTLSYQWKRNSTNVGSSSTVPTYNFGSLIPGDAGTYTVEVSGTCGTDLSAAATLVVNAKTEIGTDPLAGPHTFCEGTSGVSFTVGASGTGTLNYQWKRNGTNVGSSSAVPTYNFASLIPGDAGAYTVEVSGTCGTDLSAAATLVVNAKTEIGTDPAAGPHTHCEGTNNVSFTVGASGTGTLNYQWKRNGTNVGSLSTDPDYDFGSLLPGDAGAYTVEVSGTCGTDMSSAATLVVNAKTEIGAEPAAGPHTHCEGTNNVSFTVGASGTGTLNYQWKRNGTNVGSLSTDPDYDFGSLLPGDAGAYTVEVSGTCGTDMSSAATLVVNAKTEIGAEPAAGPHTHCEGTNNISFTVGASGTGTLNYQWKRNGTNVGSLSTDPDYDFGNLLPGDAGAYTVEVSGTCGTDMSSAATLVVNAKTEIGTDPAAGPHTHCEGTNNISFTVGASGTGTLNYQWKRNGTNVGSLSTDPDYDFGSLLPGDAGAYTVEVSGTCGTDMSSAATLVVQPKTEITTEPALTQTVCEGTGGVSFTVVASGTGALSYQWKKNGTNINPSNIANYVLPGNVLPVDAGSYTVEVSGTCGTDLSNASTLVIQTKPAITTQPTDQSACEGGSGITFTSAAVGTGLSYQWQTNNGTGLWTNLASENDRTLTLNNVPSSSNDYAYHVVVTGTCSPAVTSNDAVLKVSASAVVTLRVSQPISITDPANTTLCEGNDVVFGCSVASASGLLNYQWQQNGGAGWHNITGANNASFAIRSISSVVDRYQYRVMAGVPGCVQGISNPATVFINSSSRITENPVDAHTCEANEARFSVSASGTNLQYQWQVNTPTGWENITFAQSEVLSLLNVGTTIDGNQYRAVVNMDGCPPLISSAADLFVNQAPRLIAAPSDITVCENIEATFAVSAEGAVVFYQWEVNNGIAWTVIENETSPSLVLNQVSSDMNGYQFRVVLNTVGCTPVTSGAAQLTVNTVPGEEGCLLFLQVSEGLSPNGDNVLDYWVIQGIELYPNNQVKLYNVWGDLVFEQKNYDNASRVWRGETNKGLSLGQHAPDGTYFYYLNLGNDTSPMRGFVVLKR